MKTKFFMTIGRIEGIPTTRVGKDGKEYRIIKVHLFGGMMICAFVGSVETEHDKYVGVRIAPRGDDVSYTIFELTDPLREFLAKATESRREAEATDDYYDLPF